MILRAEDAPQPLQRHLCVPALVLPFFIILTPQTPHFGLGTARPDPDDLFLEKVSLNGGVECFRYALSCL